MYLLSPNGNAIVEFLISTRPYQLVSTIGYLPSIQNIPETNSTATPVASFQNIVEPIVSSPNSIRTDMNQCHVPKEVITSRSPNPPIKNMEIYTIPLPTISKPLRNLHPKEDIDVDE